MDREVEVSVVIPCLNEEEAIGECIKKIKNVFSNYQIKGEIIVSDNGSTDNSVQIARSLGAVVVKQPKRGYGAAYLKGISYAQGKFIIMGDGDNSYDFKELPKLLKYLREGYDFVIGSRFKGKILKGAMPFSNRYIGNPILTTLLNIFYRAKISDAHSGFRGIRAEVLSKLHLKTTGMEFASEMIIAALREGLKIKEVPITYHPRKGKSKLHPFSDAWRHIRFMLLFSPTYLFFIPGMVFSLGGFLILFFSGWGGLVLLGHKFDIHAMIFASIITLLGLQICALGLYAKTYSFLEGFERRDKFLRKFYRLFNLERGLIIGSVSFLGGLIIAVYIFLKWVKTGFGPLNEIKAALLGLILMVGGVQIIFSSFFLSLLSVQKRR